MSIESIESVSAATPSAVAGRGLSLHWLVIAFLLIEVSLLVLCGALPTWYLAALGLSADDFSNYDRFQMQIGAAAVAVVIFLVMARQSHIYSLSRILDATPMIRRLFMVLVVTFSALIAIAAATKTTQIYSRLWFFSWASSAIVLIILARIGVLAWLQWQLQHGACVFRALSVGIGVPPLSTEQLLVVTGNRARAIRSSMLHEIEDVASLADAIRSEHIDQIYITAPWAMMPELASGLTTLRFLATDIFLCCSDRRLGGEIASIRQFGSGLALQAAARPIGGWQEIAKRCEDVAVASLALVFASPVMILTAIAIMLESPGPVLFRQNRKGLNGREFTLQKFRSMYCQHADAHAASQTCRDDARVTRVGRFIRRWSIDELPQLFNVIEGSMSIVGPRPHALSTSAAGHKPDDVVEYYASRYRVKPGMTGWAQVNGLRGELNSVKKLQARVDSDLSYIERWSFWLDLKIIALTAREVFFTRNAY
jgi:Undecaprenyl-phosphate glucose phosphotransferase